MFHYSQHTNPCIIHYTLFKNEQKFWNLKLLFNEGTRNTIIKATQFVSYYTTEETKFFSNPIRKGNGRYCCMTLNYQRVRATRSKNVLVLVPSSQYETLTRTKKKIFILYDMRSYKHSLTSVGSVILNSPLILNYSCQVFQITIRIIRDLQGFYFSVPLSSGSPRLLGSNCILFLISSDLF